MLEGTRSQAIFAATLRPRVDHVRLILIISKAVNDNRAAVREYGLNLEHAPDGLNIIPQRTEIHVRALFDAGDRALRHVQHLSEVGLCKLFGTAEFFQGHAL